MLIKIDKDERYPDYTISSTTTWGREAEVPDEQIAEWNRVRAEYKRVQDEMGLVFEAAPKERY